MRTAAALEATLLAKSERAANGCLHWTGYVMENGYGTISMGRGETPELVHRVAHALWVGPIPDGLDVDHICHNADPSCPGGWLCLHRRCVEREHLEAKTRYANLKAGRGHPNKRKTECPQHHPYTPDNTYIASDGRRRCRTCLHDQRQRRRP